MDIEIFTSAFEDSSKKREFVHCFISQLGDIFGL